MTDLDADEVLRIILDEKLVRYANWYGHTGRAEISAWIDREGDEWLVWQTDERGGRMHDPIRYTSEAEALDFFLQMARYFRRREFERAREMRDTV